MKRTIHYQTFWAFFPFFSLKKFSCTIFGFTSLYFFIDSIGVFLFLFFFLFSFSVMNNSWFFKFSFGEYNSFFFILFFFVLMEIFGFEFSLVIFVRCWTKESTINFISLSSMLWFNPKKFLEFSSIISLLNGKIPVWKKDFLITFFVKLLFSDSIIIFKIIYWFFFLLKKVFEFNKEKFL